MYIVYTEVSTEFQGVCTWDIARLHEGSNSNDTDSVYGEELVDSRRDGIRAEA